MTEETEPFNLVARDDGRCLVWMPEHLYRFLLDLKNPSETLGKLWSLQHALGVEPTKDRYFGNRQG